MRQIIALGGGGFAFDPENTLIEEYILRQSMKDNPTICFIGTASGDEEAMISSFYEIFSARNASPSDLSLFGQPPKDLNDFLSTQDIVYVGPGWARNLIVLWKEWGLDTALRNAWDKGVILAGVSAGSVCWYEEGLTMWHPPDELGMLTDLGLIQGSQCPHYNQNRRRETFYTLFLENKVSFGIGVEDDVAIHYSDNKIVRCVSSRPSGKAYRISHNNGKIVEHQLKVDILTRS
ncbi:Type 1 glutamine amidotransferase-like domain-containing protein [Alicyclobacillus curvatus]|nr:Type 1 glutamine amidotransferase-like domain-containing protein [Alicyclobacillus curvatus]